MHCHFGESEYRMENLSTEMHCYVTKENLSTESLGLCDDSRR